MNVKPIAKNIVKHMYKQGLSINAFSIKSGISKACIVKVSSGTAANVRPRWIIRMKMINNLLTDQFLF
ncbi:MAG: hypothetical protein ACI3ZR_09240 [bacterium]